MKFGKEEESEFLDDIQAGICRSLIGILLYMAPDRLDCQFAISGLASAMSQPRKRRMEWVRHLVGYMCNTRNFCLMLKWRKIGDKMQETLNGVEQHEGEKRNHCLEVYSDSDWAGSADRKTISSVCICLDGNVIYTFSRKQQSRALSSCEGEFTACESGLAECLYLQECVEAITNEKVEIFSFLDSSSAKALFMRRGVGRVRHLDTRLLWAQDLFQQQRAFLRTVRTKWNIADCGTKALSQRRMTLHVWICRW